MSSWQDIARGVREHRDGTIAKLEPPVPKITDHLPSRVIGVPPKYLSTNDVEITETPIKSLLSSLAQGKLSAVAVAEAFLRRAAIAQQLTNCVHELLPERALSRAKQLDESLAANGKPVGPLHGLPISVKAHIGMKDLSLSAGFVGWAKQTSPIDAIILDILLEAGAVLYVRTTEPQGLMALETSSNITGTTTNPHNTSLSSGGSSGGEGALQALLGSVLGIGSDIGGSIRSPAGNCGIYGLRPSTFRLPLIGVGAYVIGCETVWGTIGPMSTSLEGIDLFMRTVLASEPWKDDLSLHQIPWRASDPDICQAPQRLTVGVMWDDGVVKPSPPVTRAMKEVVEKLKTVPGVQVVEWKPFDHAKAMDILTRLYSPDGGDAFARQLATSGEPWNSLTAYTLRDTPGIESLSLQGVWDWTKEREIYRWSYLQEWNTKTPDMDVILCPVGPIPAPKLETSRYWGYTSIWNLLDYPAIVFPVSKVDPNVDVKDESYVPRNDIDQWTYDHYNAHEQTNAPVSLQLVAKKMEDEKVVETLNAIKKSIGLPFVDCLKP